MASKQLAALASSDDETAEKNADEVSYDSAKQSNSRWVWVLYLRDNRNRKLLLEVMQKQGFVNYPNEWWHFCYGDRMWAAYSNKSSCFYGLVEEI